MNPDLGKCRDPAKHRKSLRCSYSVHTDIFPLLSCIHVFDKWIGSCRWKSSTSVKVLRSEFLLLDLQPRSYIFGLLSSIFQVQLSRIADGLWYKSPKLATEKLSFLAPFFTGLVRHKCTCSIDRLCRLCPVIRLGSTTAMMGSRRIADASQI